MWEWLVVFQRELLLFSGAFFLLGAIDELAIDIAWLWVRLTGRAKTKTLSSAAEKRAPLRGGLAVFVATWQESEVIGQTLRRMLVVWPHAELRIYLGCYRNDAKTIAAAIAAAGGAERLRLVIHDVNGPTTKADCLNRMHRALAADERQGNFRPRAVIIHDAEDLVDPAELNVIDEALQNAEFVQLPVLALPQRESRFVGGHYIEEFVEAHSKAMVVRGAFGASIPAAGVGCAVSRKVLHQMAEMRGDDAPFAADSLTEDYELGLNVNELGGRSCFVRQRAGTGRLVATRAYFPSCLASSVRQKARWMHGIAFDGWDRTGWSRKPAEIWMRARDRRGPIAAILLAAAYLMLILGAVTLIGMLAGAPTPELEWELWALMVVNLCALLWRAGFRFLLTAREYGIGEGVLAVLRIPVGNVIAMMAGRRAVVSYFRSLSGHTIAWDKTSHEQHLPIAAKPARGGRKRGWVVNEHGG